MKRNFIFYFLIMTSNISYAFEALTVGVGISAQNKDSLWDTSIPYAIARQGQRQVDDSKTVTGFIEISSSIWSISTGQQLIETSASNRAVKGGWSLTRWPTESDNTNKKIYDMDMGAGFTEEQQWDKPHVHLGSNLATGCLGSSPLRYGDIDGDSKQELAIFAQDNNLQLDLILFSPEKKSVTFSARLALQDYIPFPVPTATTQNNFPYQYISEENQLAYHIGIRAYAKIFIDDFNGNNKKDILVWRKRFQSLKLKDTKKGFELNLEAFNHYELDGGEYKKQPTDNATIKNWLAAKQLTWQKGYPSKSECKGQEGQLIPEMHDALLNDPDVLK